MAHIGFKQLSSEIQKKGHGKYNKATAKKIAAKVGMEKMGKKAFLEKAAAGRRKAK